MESVAPEAFSDMKGSELISSTRAGMIPVRRNYEEGRGFLRGEESQLLKEDKKGILRLYHSEEPEHSSSRRSVGLR